jgi:hypothetical protein
MLFLVFTRFIQVVSDLFSSRLFLVAELFSRIFEISSDFAQIQGFSRFLEVFSRQSSFIIPHIGPKPCFGPHWTKLCLVHIPSPQDSFHWTKQSLVHIIHTINSFQQLCPAELSISKQICPADLQANQDSFHWTKQSLVHIPEYFRSILRSAKQISFTIPHISCSTLQSCTALLNSKIGPSTAWTIFQVARDLFKVARVFQVISRFSNISRFFKFHCI